MSEPEPGDRDEIFTAPRVITCESCGTTFESGWTEAEATEEAVKIFGGPRPDDAATVCDGCYALIMAMAAERDWPKQWEEHPLATRSDWGGNL